ncbi:Globin domain-containing protein [Caenorhabditis elegans]|uniref:Globin n=1 Tax=Caenorhabditis elegans TaxID=6239 RepID=G5EF00_CAEEL|nr:Globin family profile domain-containing protein [Caenorhabditis elegans]ABO31386.1 globin [Caenorhabditis elegans]CCD73770.1 Globin family profile domain-containing protein [Caenorhabditis elegans]|eukprot:NP_497442.2 GLoBin related [Caenorhabditis elegans]
MESLSHLTPIDREILNKSWGIVSKDMQQVAVNIFQMIFEQAPDAKLMFSFMMKDYKEDKKSNEFIFHAVRFLQVIESTMTHLEDPAQLDAVFLNLGKIHAKHEEQLGFSAHYWSVFKECVLFHFRKAMKSHNKFHKRNEMSFAEIDSAIILWREVLRFIIDRMKVGYSESGAIRKSNKQAINGQHSISGDDSGLSSGLSVETKQDLTQVKISAFSGRQHRTASTRHSLAYITATPAEPMTSSTCNFLKTLASMSPKCVRRRFSASPNARMHV